MAKTATLTLRVSEDLKARLHKLAVETDRTPSVLANRALEAYVSHHLWMLEEVDKGLEDIREGRVVSHEDAMARIDATLKRHRKSAA